MNDLIGSRSANLTLFARVVEAGGFTAAAKSLGIPQTTVSRRVAKLEEDLGVRLLERTTRTVSVTDVGRRIYQNARRVLDEVEGAHAIASTMLGEPTGFIRISAPVVFGQHLLAPAVASYLADHPKVTVQVNLTGRVVDLVEEGYDIAVRVGALQPSALIKRRIMWANAGYFARRDVAATIKQPEDLEAADWLSASNEPGPAEWLLMAGEPLQERYRFKKEPRVTSSEIDTLIACAQAGLGVAVLPEFAAPSSLQQVLPPFLSKRVEINTLTPSHKGVTPAVRTFLDHLRAHCAYDAN